MPFVERLRDLQRAFRGEAEAAVGFALQARQIVKLGSNLRARLFLLHLDDALFAAALALDGLGDFVMPQSRRGAMLFPEQAMFRIKPLLGIRQI